MSRVLIQAAGSGARKHFNETLKNGIAWERFEKYLAGRDQESLLELRHLTVGLWGFTPSVKGKEVKNWLDAEVGDRLILYSKGRGFFMAEIAKKLHNKEIAMLLWGMHPDRLRTWEYLVLVKNIQNIDVPLDFVKLLDKNYRLGANLLNTEDSQKVLATIKEGLRNKKE